MGSKLIFYNVYDDVNLATPILLKSAPDVGPVAVGNFSAALENATQINHSKMAEFVDAIAPLGKSPHVRVRRAAIAALGQAGSMAIPALKGALSDNDQTVRYSAVCGLAQITTAGEIPSIGRFQEREDQYLSFWKDWSASH